MALDPFSSGADASGTSGVGGYAAGTGPGASSRGAMNPAFARSGRDLASDSGPAAAPHGMLTTPNAETETLSGSDPHRAVDPDRADDRDRAGQPRRKTNPDVDPDTRLGLRPTTERVVTSHLTTYPVTGPRSRMATGALAGLLAAVLVVGLSYVLMWSRLMPQPPSVAAAKALLGPREVLAQFAGAAGALAAGAVYGLLFGLLVRRPTVIKGMAFGLVPALVQWLVLSPLIGEGLFFRSTAPGLLLPVLFNVLLWGGGVGYYCGRWLRPPYTGAVHPDLTSAVPNP